MQSTRGVRHAVLTGLGLGLVALTLLLDLPGVSVVQADEPLVSEAAPGPTCAAEDGSKTAAAVIGDIGARVERMRAAEIAAAGPDGFIALNGRGYNYGPALAADDVERIREALEHPSPGN
jgi:hypothetical protein